MIKFFKVFTIILCVLFASCSSDEDMISDLDNTDMSDTDNNADTDDSSGTEDPVDGGGDSETDGSTILHAAFAEFDSDYVDIYLDGSEVVIEASGVPNHTTPYYSENHELYVAPSVTSVDKMTPTRIDTSNRDHEQTLIVDSSPQKASSSTSTNLGPVGVAVSGAYIYNDEEGNGALDAAAVSLDYTGAHIGPDYYHYHLEPKAFTNDDGNLVGIIADGFFLYGRRDYPSNEYPTDLDASGGHFGPTPHNPDGEYHYHIINEIYSTTGTYIVFAGPYIGTPNGLN